CSGLAREVAQRIDAVVAPPIGDQNGVGIAYADKAGWIAAGRTIQAFGPDRGHYDKRGFVDKGPVVIGNIVDFLDNRGWNRLAIEPIELFERGNAMHGEPSSCYSGTRRESMRKRARAAAAD